MRPPADSERHKHQPITVLVDGEVSRMHITRIFQAADVADEPVVVTVKIEKLAPVPRDIEAMRVLDLGVVEALHDVFNLLFDVVWYRFACHLTPCKYACTQSTLTPIPP